ncbi:MAG: hypothetical protein H7Z11_22850 [Verrucomicrobia bacterium]|nr:hypothetical protein [Leptolyngbya sp. ES-bin-22]
MKLNAPETWSPPTETVERDALQLGRVPVPRWRDYPFWQAPKHPMAISRVEVLETRTGKRRFNPLWLAWLGKTLPPLETLWLKDCQRFALEHWYCLSQQRLDWTQPQCRSVQARERWSDLMPWLGGQLWLAREDGSDHPLPWQSPQDALSPGRVAQAFATILVAIGAPACAPRRRGQAPGRATGQQPFPRTR